VLSAFVVKCFDPSLIQRAVVNANIIDQSVPESTGHFCILSNIDRLVIGSYRAGGRLRDILSSVNVQDHLFAVIHTSNVVPFSIIDALLAI
jgi:hypothetical protein